MNDNLSEEATHALTYIHRTTEMSGDAWVPLRNKRIALSLIERGFIHKSTSDLFPLPVYRLTPSGESFMRAVHDGKYKHG